jgi:hypothetical protein
MKIRKLKTEIKYKEEISKYLKNNNKEYFKYYINGFLLNDGHLNVYHMEIISGIRLKDKKYVIFIPNNEFLLINFKEILKYKKIDINGNQINNFQFILFYYVFKIKHFFYRNYINFKMVLNEKFE